MVFSPIVPFSGLQGWQFLSKTLERQKQAFESAAPVERELEYFRQEIGKIRTADELVDDRRLLSVSLTAFGLEDDIKNKFLIKKVLEEGSLDSGSLANRFSDKRYLKLTEAFGFGDFDVPRTALSNFPAEISDLFLERAFEVSVGEKDGDLRLALALESKLVEINERTTTEVSKWFSVLGDPPLKSLFETALGLGSGFGNLNIDRQAAELKERSQRLIGISDFSDFSSNETLDSLRNRFLVNSEISFSTTFSPKSVALSLLQSGVSLRF